jgi:hypothetical protein
MMEATAAKDFRKHNGTVHERNQIDEVNQIQGSLRTFVEQTIGLTCR